ncbi:MAG: SH3 domain-containing protein [Clostridia bacterium]|nr:SH3 domain-containing protein [Clostridia bacterium]
MKNRVHLKKIWLPALVIVILFALAAVAQAVSVAEWNRSCSRKTKYAVGVFATTDPHLQNGPVISIPVNTYVQVISSEDGIAFIEFMMANGQGGAGYVRSSGLTSAMISYTDANGHRKTMHELVYQDKYGFIPASRDAGYLPDETTENDKKPSESKPSSSNGSKKKTAAGNKFIIVRYGDEAAQLVRLGVASSTIMLNGEELVVPTSELDFGSTAEKEKQVAVIHAPKTGKCTLRAKASDSGKALQKCKAGTVVMVLEYGSKWCKISDDGNVGYVQTDCLKWYDAETEGTGLLSYNGKTTGSTTINVRNAPSGDSAKIAEWETGTEVEVFGLEKGWYEIEYNGIHGFVMEKFLTVEE